MIRSSILLVSCDFTKLSSISLAFLKLDKMTSLVISLNTILLYLSFSRDKVSYKCHDIASPSRSGSVAKYTKSEFFTSFFNSLTSFFLPFIIS